MPSVIMCYVNNLYRCKNPTTSEMCILGCFLGSDVGCYRPSFKEWVFEPYLVTSGNVTGLEKDGDNILLDDLYSEQEDGGPYFAIPKKEFIRILEEWEQFCKTKPDEILITQDETGKITLEAKESSE